MLAICAAACSTSATKLAQSASQPFHLTATIQELMDGLVNPSADALWDSVAFIATQSGTEDRRPRTDAEWAAVRLHAVTLIEATNLLGMSGRRVSDGKTLAGPGELSAIEIQQRIDTSPENFTQFAGLLQTAGLRALAAIDAKDPQGLMDAGGVIDEACEACHVTYWYPNQKRPGTK